MNTQDMKTLATDIDALRLRVADLESAGHRMALDLECLLMDCKDTAVTAKWFDSGMNSVSEWRDLFEYRGPRLENA